MHQSMSIFRLTVNFFLYIFQPVWAASPVYSRPSLLWTAWSFHWSVQLDSAAYPAPLWENRVRSWCVCVCVWMGLFSGNVGQNGHKFLDFRSVQGTLHIYLYSLVLTRREKRVIKLKLATCHIHFKAVTIHIERAVKYWCSFCSNNWFTALPKLGQIFWKPLLRLTITGWFKNVDMGQPVLKSRFGCLYN